MKIKSPIGFLALWSAFLAAGTWILPVGVLWLAAPPVAVAAPRVHQETEGTDALQRPAVDFHAALSSGELDRSAFVYDDIDLNADGTNDVLLVQPSRVLREDGRVMLLDGATAQVVLQIDAYSGEYGFGDHLAVLADCNADGVRELAIGTVVLTPQGPLARARVISGATGSLLAVREARRAGGNESIAIVDREAGDVDADGIVDLGDVAAVVESQGLLASASPCADMDADGMISTPDLVSVVVKATDPSAAGASIVVNLDQLVEVQIVTPAVGGAGGGAGPGCVTKWIGGWSCYMEVLLMVGEVVGMLALVAGCLPTGAAVTPAALPCLYGFLCTFAAFLGTLMAFVNSCLTTCPNTILGNIGATLIAIGALCDGGLGLFTTTGGKKLIDAILDVYRALRAIA